MVIVFSRSACRCVWRMMKNELYCARDDRAVNVVVDSQHVLLHRGEVAVIQGDADIQQEVAAGRH
jgi:hypothetical protein